ncbi:hypothetical protein [Sphingopyxis macrogoltabida]|uniref:Uncharacterized protein n=1 Tax=Sphingopyxis macrogoltabida TaxID=33050 RepID=A0AAC8Z236_SPHMC|nr:hypothetical protein [Sphingopyxis macrogoltabida]ALJ14136.1 hypothetical protein LH19_14780 [Sphingopyxis macrogoltabida]AMU90402.1 hypothetical protein ATM17_15355 [Sphingopyxis macrogoltabida]
MTVPATWPRDIAAAGGAYWQLPQFNDEPLNCVFTVMDTDYTDADFEGGVRAAFEESSPVLKAFTFSTELVEGHTIVTFGLSESDIQDLREGTDPGANETLFWNLKVTPDGEPKRTWFAGEFILMGA